MTENNETVSKNELLKELYGEFLYHSNGGTTYRTKTSELALEVVRQLSDTACLLDRDRSFEVVQSTLVDEDTFRLQDVSKMLFIVTRDLFKKKTLPADMQSYVEEKRKQKKPLAFV